MDVFEIKLEAQSFIAEKDQHILAHGISEIIKQKRSSEFRYGVFVHRGVFTIRTAFGDKDEMMKIIGIVLDLVQKHCHFEVFSFATRLSKRIDEFSVRMDYGAYKKHHRDSGKSRYTIVDGRLCFSSNEKPVISGLDYEQTEISPKILGSDSHRLRQLRLSFRSKSIFMSPIVFRGVRAHIANPSSFLEMYISGVGSRKNYGMGLISCVFTPEKLAA